MLERLRPPLEFLAPVLLLCFCVSGPVHAQLEGDCGPIDLVLCVDDTGSMQDAIDNVVRELPEIIDAVQAGSGGDHRAGLITFKDAVNVRHTLDTDTAIVRATINALRATGGAGLPEASDMAMRAVIDMLNAADNCPGSLGNWNVPYRPDAIKIMVNITDDLPGGCDDRYVAGVDDVAAAQVAADAAAAGIVIGSIWIPGSGNDPRNEPIMRNYAIQTGGAFLEARNDGRGTGDGITFIIDTCGGARECVGFDFDSEFLLIRAGTDVSGNFLRTQGVRVFGNSGSNGSPGVFAIRPGGPGSETEDMVPTDRNYITTLANPADPESSDYGTICVDFIDPVSFMPRPVEYAEITFLDVEDSVGVMTAYSEPGCTGEVLFESTVTEMGDGSQAEVSVGRMGSKGEVAIGSVRIQFGDSTDSVGLDRLCFIYTANRIGVNNHLGNDTILDVVPGDTVDIPLTMVHYRDYDFSGNIATVGILRPESPNRKVVPIVTEGLFLPSREEVVHTASIRIPPGWGNRNIGATLAIGQIVCDEGFRYLRGDYATIRVVAE